MYVSANGSVKVRKNFSVWYTDEEIAAYYTDGAIFPKHTLITVKEIVEDGHYERNFEEQTITWIGYKAVRTEEIYRVPLSHVKMLSSVMKTKPIARKTNYEKKLLSK